MDQFREILLEVWREACRHIEITASTATITRMLVKHMPVAQVHVRRITPERRCVETVALGLATSGRPASDARTECTTEALRRLLVWWREGRAVHQPRGSAPQAPLTLVIPLETHGGDVLAGPIGTDAGARGALVLVARENESFLERHLRMIEVLLDPFSAALENDQRLREMAALREAAEADKRSLLTRLGRKDLGDTIIGADSGLRSVMERVELVARSEAPVLIVGETGTGKELVARTIHRGSSRASGPVIRVNCGAIPPELIDSHLFGHESGAFTGATATRQGWFERADGGTLFLDEIGELPLAAQVRLLRILQDGWLERVGGRRPIKVDVRIVAATNCDLAAMVADGTFREDLYYRIAVFPVLLPPLRDRVNDIPALARHFAQRAATRFGLPVLMPCEQDLALLARYPWPGNVRELASVMDRAAILGNGRRLEIATALGGMNGAGAGPGRAADVTITANAARDTGSEILSLDGAMRRHIETALAAAKGRIEGPFGAATLLKINPHTLRARMRKLHIDWKQFRANREG